jgi:hypothetical protein
MIKCSPAVPEPLEAQVLLPLSRAESRNPGSKLANASIREKGAACQIQVREYGWHAV